jgi:thioesterase domain-containing protein
VKGTTHIVPLKKGNGKMPLYIICHIGVAPLTRFIQFAGLLDERQPVYGIQLPEVSEMDTDSISIEAIAAKYVADLLEQDPDGPYAFAGYSIGGLIAVEMAKQLEARGKKVTLLCLFDTIAYTKEAAGSTVPVNAIRKKQMEFYAKLTRMAHTLYYKIDNNIYLLKLDTRSAIRSKRNMLLRRIKNFFRIRQSPEQQPEVQPFWKEIQKMSLAAYEKYKLTPYDGNITLFRTKRRTFYFADPKSLGWRPYAKAVKVYETEGNHYTMFHPSHCTHLAKQVQQCLDGCEDNRDYRSL